jgi:hypothetical protein
VKEHTNIQWEKAGKTPVRMNWNRKYWCELVISEICAHICVYTWLCGHVCMYTLVHKFHLLSTERAQRL